MFTIIIFIFVLSLLIFVHEIGHFIMAKKAGIVVEEFGFGFPPRIWGIKKGDTVYSINAIPFGGFVKMLGGEEEIKDLKSFSVKSIKTRAKVIVMGVLMNFLLAVILFALAYSIGFKPFVPGMEKHFGVINTQKVVIQDVEKDTPAEKVGLKKEDVILGVDGEEIFMDLQLIQAVQNKEGQEVNLKINRQGEIISKTLVPYKEKIEGVDSELFRLGIIIDAQGKISSPFYLSPYVALAEVGRITKLVFFAFCKFFGDLFLSFTISPDVAGPVGIVSLTGQAARLGWLYLVQFIAFLSINLGIINLAPFPALDGGRLLFLAIEKIRGKKINQKIENLINNIGFALLILLILAITYHDILRF
jgi:regulator of sigma E protease